VQLAATLAVAGTFTANGTVTYTAVITNSGPQTQPDNGGEEFRLVLPSFRLTLQTVTADRGTATPSGNNALWNGSLAVGESATITIGATINGAVAAGTVVSVQGQAFSDTNLNGTHDTVTTTDDPGVAGTTNPTAFTVQ